MNSLVETIRDSYFRIGCPKSILVAYSAGADSLALLLGLMTVKNELPIEIVCAHVNHGLRASACADEKLAIDITRRLDIALMVKRVEVSREGNLEAAARETRYTALKQAMRESGAQVIALAHHADDQAETMMMNLARGSGLDGLAGMNEFRPPYWRPLLSIPKSVLIDALKGAGMRWAEDESNQDTAFLRNDLRLNVLPKLERRASGVAVRMSRTAGLLQDEKDMLENEAASWLSCYAKAERPFFFLMTGPLNKLHLAMQRRVLRALCFQAGVMLDYEQTQRVLSFLSSMPGSILALPKNNLVFLSSQRLHILSDNAKLIDVVWQQPQRALPGEGLGDGMHEQVVDARLINDALMRSVRPGDNIRPLGASGRQTMQKYLSARKIDKPFRAYWPVYAVESKVLWVPGCGVSHEAAIHSDEQPRTKLVFAQALPHEIITDGDK